MRMEKKRFDKKERSALNQAKINALEDIDFKWAKEKGSTLWEQKYNDLVAYRELHGHVNVPTKFKLDSSLGRWVSTQRKQYKDFQAGTKSLMTLERAARLEELGFRWNALDRDEVDSP